MAWNPSPEVQVVRDAAAALGKVMGKKVDRCAILFTTNDDKCGVVTYGETMEKCAETAKMGGLAYDAVFKD